MDKTPEEIQAEEAARLEAQEHEQAEQPEPMGATERLRAFEDEHLGKDAVRLHGRVERGSGSRYQNPKIMTPELRRQHAALEHLVESEKHLAEAHTKLLQAEESHEAALAAAEPRPDAVE